LVWHQLDQERLARRHLEGGCQSVDQGQAPDHVHCHDAGERQRGEGSRFQQHHRLQADDEAALVHPIGQHAPVEREQQDRQRVERGHQSDCKRGAGELEHQPSLRDRLHPGADERHRLSSGEAREVRVLEGTKRSAPRRGTDRFKQASRGSESHRQRIVFTLRPAGRVSFSSAPLISAISCAVAALLLRDASVAGVVFAESVITSISRTRRNAWFVAVGPKDLTIWSSVRPCVFQRLASVSPRNWYTVPPCSTYSTSPASCWFSLDVAVNWTIVPRRPLTVTLPLERTVTPCCAANA